MKRLTFVLATLAAMALASAFPPAPVRADTTGSFAGTVAYVNALHIGIKTSNETRDYIIPSGFDNVITYPDGHKMKYSSIKTGVFVTVQYTKRSVFGTTVATKIVVGDKLKFPSFSVSPLPSASPSARLNLH
jgi:hypothetical protein